MHVPHGMKCPKTVSSHTSARVVKRCLGACVLATLVIAAALPLAACAEKLDLGTIESLTPDAASGEDTWEMLVRLDDGRLVRASIPAADAAEVVLTEAAAEQPQMVEVRMVWGLPPFSPWTSFEFVRFLDETEW